MGLIRRSFTYLDKPTFLKLFKSLVRTQLEYASPVWHPRFKKVKTLIENVQRRATKFLPYCKDMSYEERLKYLQLPCMLYRKMRGDMIEVYKITSKKYDSQISPPIRQQPPCKLKTRGNNKRLSKDISRSSTSIRKMSFSNRVVNLWNELPDPVVNAPSTKCFEARLDRYWSKYNIKHDFERCLQFESQKQAGLGTSNMILIRTELDLDI